MKKLLLALLTLAVVTGGLEAKSHKNNKQAEMGTKKKATKGKCKSCGTKCNSKSRVCSKCAPNKATCKPCKVKEVKTAPKKTCKKCNTCGSSKKSNGNGKKVKAIKR